MASTASSVSGKRMSAVDPDVDEKLPDVNKKLDDTRAAPETSVAAPDGETQPTETAENKGEDEHEYITGFRLFTVMAAITLCVFLFLLDTAIIATVRIPLHSRRLRLTNPQGHPVHHEPVQFSRGCRLVRRRLPTSLRSPSAAVR